MKLIVENWKKYLLSEQIDLDAMDKSADRLFGGDKAQEKRAIEILFAFAHQKHHAEIKSKIASIKKAGKSLNIEYRSSSGASSGTVTVSDIGSLRVPHNVVTYLARGGKKPPSLTSAQKNNSPKTKQQDKKTKKSTSNLNPQLVRQLLSLNDQIKQKTIPNWNDMKPSEREAQWRKTNHPVKKEAAAYVKKFNPSEGPSLRNGDPDKYLQGLIKIYQKYSKEKTNSKSPREAGQVDTMSPEALKTATSAADDQLVLNVTKKFKSAKPETVKKVIELQSMLVKSGLAPSQLKNGKPFVDGVFGRSTINALRKMYSGG